MELNSAYLFLKGHHEHLDVLTSKKKNKKLKIILTD